MAVAPVLECSAAVMRQTLRSLDERVHALLASTRAHMHARGGMADYSVLISIGVLTRPAHTEFDGCQVRWDARSGCSAGRSMECSIDCSVECLIQWISIGPY